MAVVVDKVNGLLKYLFEEDEIKFEGIKIRLFKAESILKDIEDRLSKISHELDEDLLLHIEQQLALARSEIEKLGRERNELERLLLNNNTEKVEEDATNTTKPISNQKEEKESAAPQVVVATTSTIKQRNKTSTSRWVVGSIPTSKSPVNSQENRKEHEELTAELVHMARRLKQNNLALKGLVESDKKVVDQANMNLTFNSDKFGVQHRELQKFTHRSWATTWRLLFLTFLIVISVLFAFMLILVTKSSTASS